MLHAHLIGQQRASVDNQSAARSSYNQFVQDGHGDPLRERGLRQDIYPGGSDFIEQI